MENTVKKITKAQVLNFLMTQVETMNFDNTDVAAEDVESYIETTLTQLAKKNAVAAEKRAEKKAAGDELAGRIHGILSSEYQTREEITSALGDSTITVAKVGARLTALVNSGVAEKSQIKSGDRKVMGYRLIVENPDTAEVEE